MAALGKLKVQRLPQLQLLATHMVFGVQPAHTCSKGMPRTAAQAVWRSPQTQHYQRGTNPPPGFGVHTMATAASGGGGGGGGSAAAEQPGMMVVYVTVPNQEVGEKLASSLVESQLAACVNIIPGVTSIYQWEGKVNKDTELLLIIKTCKSLLDDLTAHVKANHPYDVPEVIGLPILGGSPAYLQWLVDSTKS